MAKRQQQPAGPTMVSVRATSPHTYMSQPYEAGDTYEVDEANLGAVVPRYATRTDEGQVRRTTRAVVEDADEAVTTPRRGTTKKAKKSRR
jgi:hypothetical protein